MHRDLGLCQREIARALVIGQATLYDELRRWEASGLIWPLEASTSDADLERKLFAGPKPSKPPGVRSELYHSQRPSNLRHRGW